jgi:L-lactate utilization protein LutB
VPDSADVARRDGSREVHVILLDNGRTRLLVDEIGRQALCCSRCSACITVCPVYEQAGEHAHGSVYSGRIGAVLTPCFEVSERTPMGGAQHAETVAVGITATGTVVLDHGSGRGTGVFSSSPDIHVCAGGRGSAVRARGLRHRARPG